MNSLQLAFNVVLPVFLMMLLGYLLQRIGLFNKDFMKQLNTVCFKVFLPIILFVNVYNSDFSTSFQPKLLLFAIVSVVAIFCVLMFVVPLFEKTNARRGVMVQGMFRSNYILFGLPIAISLFGSSGIGVTAVLVAFIVPLFNLLSVVALSVFKGGKIDVKHVLIEIISNPLIIGAAVAFIFVFTGLRLPNILEQTVEDVSMIATPLSLIVLGGSFTFSKLKPNIKSLIIATSGKLIFVPLCGIFIAVLLGFRGVELGALLAMFASPTAVSSFTMAQEMNADDELAGQIVVTTSLFSILTIFVGIMILSSCGLLF